MTLPEIGFHKIQPGMNTQFRCLLTGIICLAVVNQQFFYLIKFQLYAG